MKPKLCYIYVMLAVAFVYGSRLQAQEVVVPLDHNQAGKQMTTTNTQKTTALSLPFFEDFLGASQAPDPAHWTDRHVYINNTMGFEVISRGVATFDALNEHSGPYDSTNFNTYRNGDSLTSQNIDLSSYSPSDSIYLSFFYQPQGNGFMPEAQDSLMLFLKELNGSWNKVWSVNGTALQAFTQVMVPVNQANYLHAEFQFRWINKISINLNDDVWNVDYIRMDAGRSYLDTLVRDVTTTRQPDYLLNDYTSMPYNQFLANTAGELATQHTFSFRNNAATPAAVDYSYSATEVESGSVLFSAQVGTTAVSGYGAQDVSFPVFTAGVPSPGEDVKVVFEQAYAAHPQSGANIPQNDTIWQRQVFHNYLAYDDGTAERSYFLNQFATLPAKLAIEFHLNQPDTIFGVAIYFGRQVPLAFYKFFSVQLYDDIAYNGGVDQLIYQQDLLFPGYGNEVNQYWYYKFDSPVPLATGTFYLGTMQPAASGSDSLYFGLDVNRVGGNHLYYNVLNVWESSIVSGAVMMRPILSGQFSPSAIQKVRTAPLPSVSIYPNPTSDYASVSVTDKSVYQYHLTDMQGREVASGSIKGTVDIRLSHLPPGMYLLRIVGDQQQQIVRKITKN